MLRFPWFSRPGVVSLPRRVMALATALALEGVAGGAAIAAPLRADWLNGGSGGGEALTLGSECQLNDGDRATLDRLWSAATQADGPGDRGDALRQYRDFNYRRARDLQQCRQRQAFPQKALWLRLYPCDAQPGAIDRLFDEIANGGYNQIYLETFYDGRVLLPAANNPTVWPSVLRERGYENVDLLAQALQAGRERGITVYAWNFLLNFGDAYHRNPSRADALARNGQGQISIEAPISGHEIFVDPYSETARRDYQTLMAAILQRRPAGVLFDYVRYPRGTGPASVAAKVADLWIHAPASREAAIARGANERSRAAIALYLRQGSVSAADLAALDRQFPNQPLQWPGRDSRRVIADDLWAFALDHARQGVLEFLNGAIAPVQQRGLPAGAVFFPEGNQAVGDRGFDSRLQPWPDFPKTIEWHPMAYATCGTPTCIVEQVQRVMAQAGNARVIPALAGNWQQPFNGRPPVRNQAQALRSSVPNLAGVSHFAFDWQYVEAARQRKFCQLR